MNQEDFASLKRGVVEVGLMLRGELEPAREFTRAATDAAPKRVRAVCVSHEDDALTPRKIYEAQVLERSNRLRVIDDKGEALICPRERFVLLNLPSELATTLNKVARYEPT
jgi:hypothetical protein